MGEHRATIEWTTSAAGPDFLKGKYTREHAWIFDGGVRVPASASPAVVPAPWSNPANVDPEEAYVAAIASCHMLTFLHLASKAGFAIEGYRDDAIGVMTRNERGVPWVAKVTLAPQVRWGERRPSIEEEDRLHHAAHDGCFISQSVKTEIAVTPVR